MNSYVTKAVLHSRDSSSQTQTTNCGDRAGRPFPPSILSHSSSSLHVSSSSTPLYSLSRSSISKLPLESLQLILSFLPAPLTLRSVTWTSSRLAGIALSDVHWRHLWATRTAAYFAQCIKGHCVLLAEVPCDDLPSFAYIEARGGVKLRITSKNTIRIELRVDPIASDNINNVLHSLVMRLSHESNPLLLRKALYYLETDNGERAAIDSILAVRVFFSFSSLRPPHRRGGTVYERETSLIAMCDALACAWSCCQCTQAQQHLQDSQAHRGRFLCIASSGALSHATETEVVPARTGREAEAVFFPCVAPEAESLLIYAYLLRHTHLSDIHQIMREDEQKCAICSHIISPTGHSVELRFFFSSMFGSYPRFFVKAVYAVGDLPHTRIQETFNQGGDANPQLITLFHGGFGRVEVDIAPTVSREGFITLREALGLEKAFPMSLLWNVLMMATGSGGIELMEAQPSFAVYYGSSFTLALSEAFAVDG